MSNLNIKTTRSYTLIIIFRFLFKSWIFCYHVLHCATMLSAYCKKLFVRSFKIVYIHQTVQCKTWQIVCQLQNTRERKILCFSCLTFFQNIIYPWSSTSQSESRFVKDPRIQDPRKNGRKSRKFLRLAYENKESRELLSQISLTCH